MELPIDHKPGRHERHLLRKDANPLFGWPPRPIDPMERLAAQEADHDELMSFGDSLADLLRRAAELESSADSETVLQVKEAFEQHYELACRLPGERSAEKDALRQLIDLTTRMIRAAAGNDPLAMNELADEEAARAIHRRLLEHALVADLLDPDSQIARDELTASVLSASAVEVGALLEIFDPEHIALLAEDGRRLVAARMQAGGDEAALAEALDRLRILEGHGA